MDHGTVSYVLVVQMTEVQVSTREGLELLNKLIPGAALVRTQTAHFLIVEELNAINVVPWLLAPGIAKMEDYDK